MEQTDCPYKNPVYRALWDVLDKGLNVSNKVLLYRVYEGELMFPKLITRAMIQQTTFGITPRRLFLAYNGGSLVHRGQDNPWEIHSAEIKVPWERIVRTSNGIFEMPQKPILIVTYSVKEDD